MTRTHANLDSISFQLLNQTSLSFQHQRKFPMTKKSHKIISLELPLLNFNTFLDTGYQWLVTTLTSRWAGSF